MHLVVEMVEALPCHGGMAVAVDVAVAVAVDVAVAVAVDVVDSGN